MDDDGFTMQTSRRRGTFREPSRERGKAEFSRNVPVYAGTSEELDRVHARRYGREEKLGRDGKHRPGQAHFPPGSERDKMHQHYSASTEGRNRKRDAYDDEVTSADQKLAMMTEAEQEYYTSQTGGFTPRQHERLDPRAGEWRDISLSNAKNRRAFLEKHDHGYHSARDQKVHHKWAADAYGDYECAKDRQQHHEKHRSYSNADPRRDQYGRHVSYRGYDRHD